MPDPVAPPVSQTAPPDYEALIRFLVKPFLESTDVLRLDCEVSQTRPKIWVRIAFENADKSRVFGRGGRNIQAIRTVLEAIAGLSGYSIHFDIFGGPPIANGNGVDRGSGEKPSPRRSGPSRGAPRPRR
ncbi:KH domain-containing protein [Leptodesmis sp.]|uniref:KH domain-containing protein n=1 Tax=Leptodesmis sp. TaxID=3100501 RepID=UPI0040535A2B